MNPILRKFGFVLIFLLGVLTGMIGLWLLIQNNANLHYYLLEQPAGVQPQARIESFVKAIVQKDRDSAIQSWEISDLAPADLRNDLGKRRDEVISTLVEQKIGREYLILNVEWWTTCCEPSVTCNSQDAGGARIDVQFLDGNGRPIRYVFDVFTREQPYWGAAAGYPPRDWVIRDVYPYEEKPLFWKSMHVSEYRSVEP